MSTLREEILKCLNDYFYDIVSPPPATDEILKLIEKRIDELYDKTNYIDSADLLYSDIKDMLKQK